MCEAFAKNGHTVTLLSPINNASRSEDPFKFYGVEKIFKIIRFHGLFTPPQSEIRLILYGIFCCLVALLKRPNLIYGRNAHGLFFSSLMGFKFIYELHYVPKPSFKTRLILGTKRLQYLVVTTETIRKKLDYVQKKIIVASNGAELDNHNRIPAEIDRKSRIDHPLKIGYVGNLYPGKGAELVFELAKKMPKTTFHIVGGFGNDVERVEKTAPDNVILHGFYSPAEIPKLLRGFDILLLTPLRYSSGFSNVENIGEITSPLKMFEYMAAGKAILASDIPVLKEILRHNENAILVPPENISRWKSELLRLIREDKLRYQLGSRARSDVQHLYTWQKRAIKVLDPDDLKLKE